VILDGTARCYTTATHGSGVVIACDDNTYIQMITANAEQDRLWELLRDLITGEIVLVPEGQQADQTPAQTDCTPTQAYYGCGEWRR
jgi:hypothetical protein